MQSRGSRARSTALGAGEMIRGFEVGATIGMRDLRKMMADPLTVNRTSIAMFLDETLLIVALVGGVRTTMVWKIVRDESAVVLQKLARERFVCRRTTKHP